MINCWQGCFDVIQSHVVMQAYDLQATWWCWAWWLINNGPCLSPTHYFVLSSTSFIMDPVLPHITHYSDLYHAYFSQWSSAVSAFWSFDPSHALIASWTWFLTSFVTFECLCHLPHLFVKSQQLGFILTWTSSHCVCAWELMNFQVYLPWLDSCHVASFKILLVLEICVDAT